MQSTPNTISLLDTPNILKPSLVNNNSIISQTVKKDKKIKTPKQDCLISFSSSSGSSENILTCKITEKDTITNVIPETLARNEHIRNVGIQSDILESDLENKVLNTGLKKLTLEPGLQNLTTESGMFKNTL